jgi:hypothetical protein
MEFSTELDLGLHILKVITKCHFGQLDAKCELSTLSNLVFVLNIGMHITKEQLLVVGVGEAQTDTLIRCGALNSQFVVCFHNIVEDNLIEHLHFHLKRLLNKS